ncbi:hypothetical protein TDIS_1933 [Thermosulfurimonas dismutans]|uniref:Uncharacterized protein n=1 Tax=Thermosulfurimonas dismutans TaxID=999894 RepID=A0A179D1I8_9BACT|nr:hypothetical protein TDIS_1933 [Thermosulfurimonas dismutans]
MLMMRKGNRGFFHFWGRQFDNLWALITTTRTNPINSQN